METNDKKDRREDIFSRNVRAGKRTYFFDVKATRADDYYLTITESTKRFNDDGSFHYEKHRLFLYKEDFEKFANCLSEVTEYIVTERGAAPIRGKNNHHSNGAAKPVDTNSAPPVSAEEIGESKTEEEVDLVEDAHEKAMTEDSPVEIDGNVDTSENGQAEEAPENAESEIETKTE